MTDEPYAARAGLEQCPREKVTFGVMFEATQVFLWLLSSFYVSLLSLDLLSSFKIEWLMALLSAAMSDQHRWST